MSANVETMMYVREVPWHGLGVRVEEAPDSKTALEISGLNWIVEPRKIYTEEQILIPGYQANVRSKDNKVLGVVTEKYRILQNAEAFAFTDELIGGDVRYETAGALNDGRRVWLLARLPDCEIAGDEFQNFICFTNTFDGSGAVRAVLTPTRVVCQNTLSLALNNASRSWSMKHMGDIKGKIDEARMCLGLAENYMSELAIMADRYANTIITEEQLMEILNDLFPESPDMTDRTRKNVERSKQEFMTCIFMPDLKKFEGTAWQVINAASDFATHTQPHRVTKNYRENNWERIINGHDIIDGAVKAVNRLMVTT